MGESGLGPPLVVSGAGDLSPDDDLWGFDQAIAAEPGGRLHLVWRSAGAAEAGDLIYRRLEGGATGWK